MLPDYRIDTIVYDTHFFVRPRRQVSSQRTNWLESRKHDISSSVGKNPTVERQDRITFSAGILQTDQSVFLDLPNSLYTPR